MKRGSLRELVVIVVVALGLALFIQAFLIKPYRIPSESMEPTLNIGQRVLVDRIGNRFGDPAVGDIVVFHPPAGAEQPFGDKCGSPPPEGQVCIEHAPEQADTTFIKRIVAGPGDTIRVDDGRVVRNGRPVREPYTLPCGGGEGCTFPREARVPRGEYFMMGDNRGASDDSRFWGPVPRDWIIGGAFATYWPPNRIGLL
jgi:signal peptidase I